MLKTYYQVVTTQIYNSFGNHYKTEEEAKEELKREMEKYKFKPNYSFNIVKHYFENCEPDEFDQLLGPKPKKNAE